MLHVELATLQLLILAAGECQATHNNEQGKYLHGSGAREFAIYPKFNRDLATWSRTE